MNRTPMRPFAVALALLLVPLAGIGRAAASAPLEVTGDLLDPGVAGVQPVDELHYDLGDQAFQPEAFPGRVELAAQVYTPRTITGRAPVVVLLHGRHVTCASDEDDGDLVWPCPKGLPPVPSHLGYATLARNLASHGLVVVSIGANGINAVDGFTADGGASARAQLVVEHLRRIRAWDAGGTGPFARFVGHLDLGDVGLMGHSRGGEGVVAAAQLNQRIGSPFGIRAVLALAPVDFDRRVLGGVPLGVVLPYCDGDVSDLQGTSYYDDARYASPGDPAPKMTALLYGANHNFFNTVWTSGPGSGDDTAYLQADEAGGQAARTDPCLPGARQRLTATAQDQAGATLMAGFLRRYLQADDSLQRFVTGTAPFPDSAGSARWSIAFHAPERLDIARFDTPDQVRLNRFRQVSAIGASPTGIVCNASEAGWEDDPAPGVSTTSCAGVETAPTTNDTGALDVGWVDRGATVREPLASGGTDATAYDGIRLRLAVTADSRNGRGPTQDLSVVVEDTSGRRASVRLAGRTNALGRPNPGVVSHAVLNGVRVPRSEFAGVDWSRIRAVELHFDRTPTGRVSIADLAFTHEGTGPAVGPTAGGPVLPVPRVGCLGSAGERWACAVAQVAWGRDPLDDERTFISSGYRTPATRSAMVRAIVGGDEARNLRLLRFVQPYAQADVEVDDLPDRLPEGGLRRSWEQDIALLTESFAFTTGRLASSHDVIDAAYQTLLGRSADPAGIVRWTEVLDEGDAGATAMARALLATSTSRGRTVDDRFRQILGRSPSAGERARWVARLAAPDGEQQLVTSLASSESFRRAALR